MVSGSASPCQGDSGEANPEQRKRRGFGNNGDERRHRSSEAISGATKFKPVSNARTLNGSSPASISIPWIWNWRMPLGKPWSRKLKGTPPVRLFGACLDRRRWASRPAEVESGGRAVSSPRASACPRFEIAVCSPLSVLRWQTDLGNRTGKGDARSYCAVHRIAGNDKVRFSPPPPHRRMTAANARPFSFLPPSARRYCVCLRATVSGRGAAVGLVPELLPNVRSDRAVVDGVEVAEGVCDFATSRSG